MVERLSDTLDKPVTFIVHGGDIWAHPKHVRPVFRDLAHLIRNALDHGIEDLADRGDKPAIARVELRITDTGKEICIEVVDDGRGIDSDLGVQPAIAMGFADGENVQAFDEHQRQELVLEDGLSIAVVSTAISGRGTGISAMRVAVDSMGGCIESQCERYVGTTMRLRIPHVTDLSTNGNKPS
jgi:two-component system chemotaxis sensor kinase CheA